MAKTGERLTDTKWEQIKELEFQLDWAQKKLDQTIQSYAQLEQENDELKGMLEAVIQQLGQYTLGDRWMSEDEVLIEDIRFRFEEMDP